MLEDVTLTILSRSILSRPVVASSSARTLDDDMSDVSFSNPGRHTPSPPRRKSTRISNGHVSHIPDSPPAIPTTPPKKKSNPFAKLLKDKSKRAAFNKVHDSWLSGSDLTSEEESDDDNENRNNRNVDGSVDGLGKNEATAVNNILSRDVASGRQNVEVAGVPFWTSFSKDNEVVAPPIPQLHNDSAPLSMNMPASSGTYFNFSCLLVRLTRLTAIRNVGSFLQFLVGKSTPCLSWLFDAAVGPHEALSYQALVALRSLCAYSPSAPEVYVPFHAILRPLLRLGPKEEALHKLGLELACPRITVSTTDQRRSCAWTFVQLVGDLGKAKLIHVSDVASSVALLLAMGMDTETDLDFKLSVKGSIHSLITTYCPTFEEKRDPLVCSLFYRQLYMINGHIIGTCRDLPAFASLSWPVSS